MIVIYLLRPPGETTLQRGLWLNGPSPQRYTSCYH